MALPEKVYPKVPYERHVFVCTSGKTCPDRGSQTICGSIKAKAKALGITDRIRVNKSGCLNQCSHGPMLVVYPEGIWYSGVTLEDVDEIFTRTVLNGETVERLLHTHPTEEGE